MVGASVKAVAAVVGGRSNAAAEAEADSPAAGRGSTAVAHGRWHGSGGEAPRGAGVVASAAAEGRPEAGWWDVEADIPNEEARDDEAEWAEEWWKKAGKRGRIWGAEASVLADEAGEAENAEKEGVVTAKGLRQAADSRSWAVCVRLEWTKTSEEQGRDWQKDPQCRPARKEGAAEVALPPSPEPQARALPWGPDHLPELGLGRLALVPALELAAPCAAACFDTRRTVW